MVDLSVVGIQGSGRVAIEKGVCWEEFRIERAPAGRWGSPSVERQLLFFFFFFNFKGILFLYRQLKKIKTTQVLTSLS